MALSEEPGFACIDARSARTGAGRYSFVTALPIHTFGLSGGFVTVDGRTTIERPYAAFSRFSARIREFGSDPYLPFNGGMLGYVGFEGARALRGFEPARGFSRLPQLWFGMYDSAAIFDHVEARAFIVANAACASESETRAHAFMGRISMERPGNTAGRDSTTSRGELRMSPADCEFLRTLDAARSWVRAERAERIHIARHGLTPVADRTPIEFFFEKRAEDEVRAIFVREGAACIASSFEGLLEVKGRELRHIPSFCRAAASDVEREIEEELKRLCADNEVTLSKSDSGVSVFTGRLRHEMSPIDALVGLMPAHSMTGAPYDRAMDFINGNDETHRTLYGGAFGIADASGLWFRTAEAVRTIADGALSTTAGADITANIDSRSFVDQLNARL